MNVQIKMMMKNILLLIFIIGSCSQTKEEQTYGIPSKGYIAPLTEIADNYNVVTDLIYVNVNAVPVWNSGPNYTPKILNLIPRIQN